MKFTMNKTNDNGGREDGIMDGAFKNSGQTA